MPGDHAEFDGMGAADQSAVTQVVVNLGKALGAYERLLTCGPSRFDQWMHGDPAALSASEQRGAQLFVGAGHCAKCHSGPYLSDQAFHDVGVQPAAVAVVFVDADDPGAASGLAAALTDPPGTCAGSSATGTIGRLPGDGRRDDERGLFERPRILRCASKRPSFLHTGQLSTLAQVVAFFAQGGDAFGYAGTSEIAPLPLTTQDQADLTAFLEALDGPGAAAGLQTSSMTVRFGGLMTTRDGSSLDSVPRRPRRGDAGVLVVRRG